MEKPVKMRSSIACARCRRSKVKCLNNGVNTTCRNCEAAGRECLYPTTASGQRGTSSAANNGTTLQTGIPQSESGAQVNHVAPKSGPATATLAATSGSPSSLSAPANVAEKPKSRSKKPATGTHTFSVAQRQASLRSIPQIPSSEALDPSILTPSLWSSIYDLFALHYPHMPIIHRPTFLRPLTEVPTSTNEPFNPITTNVSDSTSSTPPPAPSPFLLLAVLALTARFSQTLISHHKASPAETSEYYASALRQRLLYTANGGSDQPDEDGMFTPSVPKIQSLIMLAVHELGQSEGQKAWIWLGIAVRMCQLLNMPPIDHKQGRGWIEEEQERRTWWAVVMLDRMLSSSGGGTGRAYAIGWDRVKNVPLPCSEKSWLFAEPVKAGVLDAPILIDSPAAQVNHHDSEHEMTIERETNTKGNVRDETGSDESVHARLIRLVDIWGRVCQYLCAPETSQSNSNTLVQELERWQNDLPRSLSYTPEHLSAHISDRTSSSYAMLHIFYFLSILLINRETLPVIPSKDTPSAPNPCFSAARRITEIAREMNTWLSLPLTPVICFGVYAAAWIGIYGLHHPHITGPYANGMAIGDARYLLTVIESWRGKWEMAEGCMRALAAVHGFLLQRQSTENSTTSRSSQKRKHLEIEENVSRPDSSSPTSTYHKENESELQNFDKTLREYLSIPYDSAGTKGHHDGSRKRARSNVGDYAGRSDMEMKDVQGQTSIMSNRGAEHDSWHSEDTDHATDKSGRGLHGLVAAAHANQQQLSQAQALLEQQQPTLAVIAPPQKNTNFPFSSQYTHHPQSPSQALNRLDIHSSPAPHYTSQSVYPRSDMSQPPTSVPPQPPHSQAAPIAPLAPFPSHSAYQSTSAHKPAKPGSDYSDFAIEQATSFEGWGKRSIANIDLLGFCEGNPWTKWNKDEEDNWYSAGGRYWSNS